MRIYNNVNAVNAQRNLSITGFALAKSIEKLSSGLRINRAADDAAGLSISEKLRAQIRGVQQAMRNAQDGVSMIQTAEGALNEVHSMLQRMRELAVQAANDTLTTEDRAAINSELQNLQQEINAIANRTTFNGKLLLTGSLATSVAGTSAFTVGSQIGDQGSVTNITINGTVGDGTYTISYDETTNQLVATDGSTTYYASLPADNAYTPPGPTSITFDDGSGNGFTLNLSGGFRTADLLGRALEGRSITVSSGAVDATSDLRGTPVTTIQTALGHVSAIDVSGALASDTYTFSYNGTTQELTLTRGSDGAGQTLAVPASVAAGGRFTLDFEALGVKVTIETTTGFATKDDIGYGLDRYVLSTSGNGSAHFQVGPNSGHSYLVAFNRVLVDNNSTTPAELQNLYNKLQDFADQVDSSPGTNAQQVQAAQDLITAIDGAISYINDVRSQLGAAQNRLEHTIANLGVQHENLTASESRIRDVDMAAEMVTFTRNQILQQAGVAVLAQANAMPQSVLQLLR
ncbi:flagellin [Thermomicrobium sp. 4228-Ro]|uniref:flagellin N-terminal helical domain-containing protein n=1 Tax=Thermomicrobium sp. 4228-Ro TaxID=2993937 RepID=UPI002B061891|nr:flagellin [Thermomicrobium sp. 4228-Ro]